MYAADFRQRARLALRTRWAPAVLTALVASLLGAELFPLDLQIQLDPTQIQQLLLNPTLVPIFQGMVAWSLTLAIIGFFLGGVTHLGYCWFQLNLLDQKPAQLSDLFSQFHRFGAGFCLNLLTGLFIFLWSLLLFVPGLIAAYRYAMAPYILAEDPGCTASEALARSTEMMRGYKARLFCLDLSFFGWRLLGILTLGIGNLWVNPYSTLSTAAFYRWRCQENPAFAPPAQETP